VVDDALIGDHLDEFAAVRFDVARGAHEFDEPAATVVRSGTSTGE
jgi:hypothetical protein